MFEFLSFVDAKHDILKNVGKQTVHGNIDVHSIFP